LNLYTLRYRNLNRLRSSRTEPNRRERRHFVVADTLVGARWERLPTIFRRFGQGLSTSLDERTKVRPKIHSVVGFGMENLSAAFVKVAKQAPDEPDR
jgi:hypothetical protein